MRDIKYRGFAIVPSGVKAQPWMTIMYGVSYYSNNVMWLMERIDKVIENPGGYDDAEW